MMKVIGNERSRTSVRSVLGTIYLCVTENGCTTEFRMTPEEAKELAETLEEMAGSA